MGLEKSNPTRILGTLQTLGGCQLDFVNEQVTEHLTRSGTAVYDCVACVEPYAVGEGQGWLFCERGSWRP